MLRTALTLASKGWHVFPCQPRAKQPATARGCKDGTTDREQIERWWRQEPNFNIGVATGTVSGVFVVDIDGLDAEAELRKLEREHGEIPPTVEAITSRGRHAYLKMPDCGVRNSASKIAPGVDVRGDGGYVLVPPSIHPSGRAYAWSVDSADTFAAAPRWLLDKITPPSRISSNHRPAAAPAEWRKLAGVGVDEGKRNNTLTRLAGYLLRRHVDVMVAMEMLTAWNATHCRPPLSEDEVIGIVNSIAGRELQRRGLR